LICDRLNWNFPTQPITLRLPFNYLSLGELHQAESYQFRITFAPQKANTGENRL